MNCEPSSPTKLARALACWEAWGPWIVSAALAIGAREWASSHALPQSLPNLLNGTIALSAIAIGFLATSKSVLLSLSDRLVVKQLKTSGLYVRLMGYFMTAIRWSFALAVLSVVGLLCEFETDGKPHPYVFAVWVFVLSATGACSYRVIHFFGRIVQASE